MRTTPWGVTVQSVDMRDIVIPTSLQDAMSREAQATREKQARVILSQAEVEIARSFETAALSYQANPVALQLRAMNMLYEGLKERGGLMVVPSSAVESLGMGGLMGAAALGQAQLPPLGSAADRAGPGLIALPELHHRAGVAQLFDLVAAVSGRGQHIVGVLAEHGRAAMRVERRLRHLDRRAHGSQPAENRMVDFRRHLSRDRLGRRQRLLVVQDRPARDAGGVERVRATSARGAVAVTPSISAASSARCWTRR